MPQGPNENDCTTLKDGKTILTVIRKDGGDGVPHHKHVPYFFATSKDEAASWTLREVSRHDIAGIRVAFFHECQRNRCRQAPAELLSARPRMVTLPGGALIIAGGRPALNMWVQEAGDPAQPWTVVDIPTEHNKLVADPSQQFCPEFANATAALGWAESSCCVPPTPTHRTLFSWRP